MCSENRYDGIEGSVVRMVKSKAREVMRGGTLDVFSQEDVEQELMTAALEAKRKAGTLQTASIETYVHSAIDKAAASLFQYFRAAKRGWDTKEVSLTQMVGTGDDQCLLEETITREHIAGPIRASTPSEIELADLRLDVAAVLNRLAPKDRKLCHLLMKHSTRHVARLKGITRQGLGHHRKRLAGMMQELGLSLCDSAGNSD